LLVSVDGRASGPPLADLSSGLERVEQGAVALPLGLLAGKCLPTADHKVDEQWINLDALPQDCAAISVVPLPRKGS
jgi:hypothetical protein